jgi:hypothetical protein
VNISVSAVRRDDGSVTCTIECDGQVAGVTFTGTEVLLEVPELAAGT